MNLQPTLVLSLALALGAASCGAEAPKKGEKTDVKVEAKTADTKLDAKADAKAETPPDPALLDRGKYLAEVVMNCHACHTPLTDKGPDLDKQYAGGLEYPDAFGTWRSPNITQDKRTGIGAWSDEQIITAVRRGIRPSGEQMYPVMPYEYFAAASDDDMKALVAYLRTIKPIEHAVAGNTDLKLTKPPPPEPTGDPPLPEPVAEGKYLVELAHCGDCHTPLGADGRPDKTRLLAGGRPYAALPFQGTGQVWSANLTPHATGIGKYTDEQLMTAITELDKRDGSAIVGPMTFYVGAWSQLKHKDVKAIVAYLRSLPPIDNTVPKTTWAPRAAGG